MRNILTDIVELPGVVPYPLDGNEATDHLRASAAAAATTAADRVTEARLTEPEAMGTKGKCCCIGELIRGLSIGLLAETGE